VICHNPEQAERDQQVRTSLIERQPSFADEQARVACHRLSLLLQPRCGVALVEDQLSAFHTLHRACADVLSYQVDSLTRNNCYAMAARGIAESRESGVSALNGFPMVNHGVEPMRRISSETATPLQTRHSTRDPRLLCEISCAGGITGFEGGAITYNIPYFKDYPLALALQRWQYVERLMGTYADEYGVIIDREFFGTLTAVLIPPSLCHRGQPRGGLACGRAGRAVSVPRLRRAGEPAPGRRGHPGPARTEREYLANLGYHGVRVNAVFHQHMAAFPADLDRARELITASAATARRGVLVKTPVEATMIPTLRDNEKWLALTRMGAMSSDPAVLDEKAIVQEMALIRMEVEQMFESVVVCGGGSLTAGVVRAFERGHLDIPFAPRARKTAGGRHLAGRGRRGAFPLHWAPATVR
jgi:methylaspartate mutase epsilon subunit